MPKIAAQNRSEEIQYCLAEYTTLRYLIGHIRDVFLPSMASDGKPDKWFVKLNTPLLTWFYERVLSHFHIQVKTITIYLSTEERQKLVDDFNDKISGLNILIVIYSGSNSYQSE